jgi:hypothetical protein
MPATTRLSVVSFTGSTSALQNRYRQAGRDALRCPQLGVDAPHAARLNPRLAPAAVRERRLMDQQCPRCGGQRLLEGQIGSEGTAFCPNGTRRWAKFAFIGVPITPEDAQACLDCGLIWTGVLPDKLLNFVKSRCDAATKQRLHLI